MFSAMGESSAPQAEGLRDYLIQLNALVPKSLDDCARLDKSEKTSRSEKITHILWQVFENLTNCSPEQRTNLLNIRELAKKAENMQLLSKPGKKILSKIADDTKKIGLSLYTSPRDLKIRTKDDGLLEVNSDILKENSQVFKTMFKRGMREQREQTIELKDYSTNTVEFLMRCLHASPASPIILPLNNNIVLELIDLAMRYGLEGFIKKLEPAITNFISAQPDTILENAHAWMNFLLLQKEARYGATATKWIADLTPLFLDHYEIPFKLSEVPGTYEIPIKHINSLFNEETRDLLKHLPVVLDIKDGKDLAIFEKTCKQTRLEEPLPIKLLSKQGMSEKDETRIRNLAKASNIEVSFEQLPIPPGTSLFGKEQWEKYFGKIGEVPPIPAAISKILRSPSPYFPGKTGKDMYMLTLVPATVNGKPLDFNHLLELVQDPKGGGHKVNIDRNLIYQPILDEYGDKALERSQWVLMPKDVIPDSRNKIYEQQQPLVEKNPGFEFPEFLSASACILTHFVRTGEYLFPKGKPGELWTYTRCKETINTPWGQRHIVVGGFSPAGLHVIPDDLACYHVGVAAVRKFF